MAVTTLGRAAFRQIWDEPKLHAPVRGSALAAVLASKHWGCLGGVCGLWMEMWAGDRDLGWGQGEGIKCRQASPPHFFFWLENKSASSLFLPLAFQIHLGKLPWVLAEVSPARQLVLL